MIFQFLFGLLSYLLSPFGMMSLLLGFVAFLAGPIIPRALGTGYKFAHFPLWLGMALLKRGAIVTSEHGDLLLKRISPDDNIGTEKIRFKDGIKEFEDTQEAKTHFFGIPFALADSKHGFLYTIKDAAIGRRKKEAEQRDEMVIKATEQENSMYNVGGWYRGVLEFPAKAYEFVNLNDVRQMVSGSEFAEHPQRVETYYEHSRSPYQKAASAMKFILLIVAIVGPFAALWLLATQLSDGSSTSTVTVSSLLLLSVPKSAKNLQWKRLLGSLLTVLLAGGIEFGLFVMFGPIGLFYINLLFILGYLTIPIFFQLARVHTKTATSASRLLAKIGLLGYEQPVLVETTDKLALKEYNDLDDSVNVQWHRFLGRKVGFAFDSTPELWDTAVAETNEIENTAVADGSAKTNLPSGYSVIPEKQRAVYGAFVPSRLKSSKYYVWTGILLERFAHVATGRKTHKRLEQAKEIHGGQSGMSNKAIIVAMSVLGTVSLIAGIVVFFL